MNFFDFFDSKIKDIMYDVVGLLFPGAFCLLLTMGILSIEKIQSILACVGITYKFSSISGFSGIAVFLIFAYFYGVLLKGIYETFLLEEIETYSNQDCENIKKHIDKLEYYADIKTDIDKLDDIEAKKEYKKIYRECSRKLKNTDTNIDINKIVVQYLDKYLEKRNIYRIIYAQIIIIKNITVILLLIFITQGLSKCEKIYLVNNRIEYGLLVIFLLLIGTKVIGNFLDKYVLKIFERYIKRYSERINRQILIGMENLEKKKGE